MPPSILKAGWLGLRSIASFLSMCHNFPDIFDPCSTMRCFTNEDRDLREGINELVTFN